MTIENERTVRDLNDSVLSPSDKPWSARLQLARRLLDEGLYQDAARTVFKCRLMPEGARILMECMKRCKLGELDGFSVPDQVVGHRCPYFLTNRCCKLMSVKWEQGAGPGLYSDLCPYEGFWHLCRMTREIEH